MNIIENIVTMRDTRDAIGTVAVGMLHIVIKVVFIAEYICIAVR